MKRKNYSACNWWPIIATISCLVCSGAIAQECSSPTLSFAGQFPLGEEISTTVGAGYTLAEHEVANVRSVTVRPIASDAPVYIVPTLANGKLTITTNVQFADYEKLDDKLLFLNMVVFTCTSGAVREMTFRQNIKEENNYTPSFSREVYDIKVPLPLPRDFNIQQFVDDGLGVLANDYDITKNTVTFFLAENDYFGVTSSVGATRTEFLANLITKQTLTKLPSTVNLQITAQDAWDPPRTSQARLTISGDPVIVFIAAPEFEQSLYKVSHKLGGTFTPLRISLGAGTYDATVQFQLSGEDTTYFTVTPTADRSSATVALRSGTQVEDAKTILSVTATASRTGTDIVGRTAIVVELSRDPIILPTFEETLYTGSIAPLDRTITLDTEIRLVPATTSGSEVRIQLGGDDGRYFAATLSNNQVSIGPSSALTETVLKEKAFFLLVLQADKTSVGVGETLLVLSVERTAPQETPHFEQPVYEGTITVAGVLSVPVVKIFSDSFVDGLTFSYSGDVTLFVLTSNEAGVISIVPSNITPEKLVDRTYLLLSIAGNLEGVEAAHAVIVLKVLRSAVVLPKFTTPYLEGELVEKTLEVRLPNVELSAESFTTATEVRLVDALGFFDIQELLPANVFKVFLRGTVTSGSLRGIDRIPLTVEATNPNSDTVHCVITIDVVRTAAPSFERLIYEGVIDESRQLVEPMVAKLTDESADETVQYSLEGVDASFFLLEPIDPPMEGVRVSLKMALTESEFESRDPFQLTLKATKQLADVYAFVPLVVYVKRPLVKIPVFEKPLYKSRLDVNLMLVPFEPISLERGSYLDSATVVTRYNNTDLFAVAMLEGVVTIRLLKELEQAAVDTLDRFEFVVECNNPGMASGFTTILVDIDRVIDPEFTELFYTGEVQEGAKVITFGQTISLKTDTDNGGTVYTIQGFDSALVRYVVSTTDQSLSLFLRDEVTVEQLKGRSELSFVVTARNHIGSKPSVASCLVKIGRTLQPIFTLSSYQGTIVEGQTMVDFGEAPIAWELGTVTETTAFALVDDVSLFEVTATEDRSSVTVRLRMEIKWDQVRAHTYLKLVLQATNDARSPPSQCTLVVDVVNQPTVTPVFTKAIYRGALQEGTREVTFSASDTITVQPGTIMPTFQYVVSEGDANLFDVTLNDGNKLKVSLKEDIGPVAIEGRDLLSFLVNINNAYSAVDTATILITVKLDDIVTPAFGKLLFTGRVVEGSNELHLDEAILLSAGTFTENTEVGLGGTDARLFEVSRVGSGVELTLTGPLNWPELATTARYLSVYIQATNPGSDSATAFVVIDIQPIRLPRFNPAAVYGHVEAGSREVSFVDGSALKIVSTSTEPGFQWNLHGDDYQLFDASLDDDLFQFGLKDSVTPEQLGSRSLFRFSVTLRNPTSGTVEANVLVNRPLPIPQFVKHLYSGSFDGELRLTLAEGIELTEGSFTPGITIAVGETNVDFLRVQHTDRSVQVTLSRPVTVDDFQGLEVVHLVLEARNADALKGTCTVLLTVPEGSPCIPLPPIVDCTSCYNCTTGGVQGDVPVFAYGNVWYQLRSDTIGPIGSVTATVKDATTIVQHRLDITDDYLRPRISMTPEGTLSLVQPLLPNAYSLLVHAINMKAGKQATASVLLNVLNAYECTDGEKVITVEQVLSVLHLDEDRPHSTVFPTQLGASCIYELLSESPTDAQQPYFYIDSDKHWLAARSFDREDRALFGDMLVPQFRLLLKLSCDVNDDDDHDNVSATESGARSLVKRSLIETGTINYAPDVTVLTIIVDDVNDNDPVFVLPLEHHVAYPNPSLASRLMLAHLITAQATDADEGLNAKIRFSLSGADAVGHFMINPEEGTVHPTRDALRETNLVELTVIATDRDGAVDGRRTEHSLTVHRLNDAQIAIVTLALDEETTLEDVLAQINHQEAGFRLQLLHRAYVPATDDSTAGKRGGRDPRQTLDRQRAMRLVVYALDASNEPLDTDSIRSGIRNAVPSIQASAIVSFSEAVCSDNQPDPACPEGLAGLTSNAGLIASTSVLGVLLLISLAIGSVLYVRYVRPLSSTTTDSSDIEQLENDFDPSPPSTPPTNRDQERVQEAANHDHDRKISINITGITKHESEDIGGGSKRLARSLTDRLDEEDEYGGTTEPEIVSVEPKNVKFNEVVERIEVQDHHSDDENEDDEGDGTIYEERL